MQEGPHELPRILRRRAVVEECILHNMTQPPPRAPAAFSNLCIRCTLGLGGNARRGMVSYIDVKHQQLAAISRRGAHGELVAAGFLLQLAHVLGVEGHLLICMETATGFHTSVRAHATRFLLVARWTRGVERRGRLLASGCESRWPTHLPARCRCLRCRGRPLLC